MGRAVGRAAGRHQLLDLHQLACGASTRNAAVWSWWWWGRSVQIWNPRAGRTTGTVEAAVQMQQRRCVSMAWHGPLTGRRHRVGLPRRCPRRPALAQRVLEQRRHVVRVGGLVAPSRQALLLQRLQRGVGRQHRQAVAGAALVVCGRGRGGREGDDQMGCRSGTGASVRLQAKRANKAPPPILPPNAPLVHLDA